LVVKFIGTSTTGQLRLGGEQMAAGVYDRLDSWGFFRGTGSLLAAAALRRRHH
jgi:hypothetical protein